MQVLKVRKDRKEAQVIMEQRDHQVSGVVKAQLAPEENPDLKDLALKAKEVLSEILAFLVLLDLLVLLDQKAHLELLGFQVYQVNQDLRASVARQDHLGLKVTEDLLGSRE